MTLTVDCAAAGSFPSGFSEGAEPDGGGVFVTSTPPLGDTLTLDFEPSGFVVVAVTPEGVTDTSSFEGSEGV